MDDEVKIGALDGIKGKATIQIFNEDGIMHREEEKSNYIQPVHLWALSKIAPMYGFIAQNNNNFLATNYMQQTAVSDPWSKVNNLMSAIALTNHSDPILKDADFLLKGKVIGYAEIHNAGSGSYRGTLNKSESISQLNYRKLVYDFATSEAIGTFQSIYTGAFFGDTSTGLLTRNDQTSLVTSINNGFPGLSNIGAYIENGGFIYVIYSVNISNIYSLKIVKISILNFGGVVRLSDRSLGGTGAEAQIFDTGINTSYPQANYFNFDIKGSNFYIYSRDKLYVMPISGASPASELTTIPPQYNTISSGHRFMSINQVDGVIWFAPSLNVLLKYSLTGELLSTNQQNNGTSQYIFLSDTNYKSKFSKIEPHAIRGNQSYYNNLTLEKIEGLQRSMDHVECSKYLLFKPSLSSSENSSEIQFALLPDFFSRILMDNPVTKNANQTMKITYEFFIDGPVPTLGEYT